MGVGCVRRGFEEAVGGSALEKDGPFSDEEGVLREKKEGKSCCRSRNELIMKLFKSFDERK